MEDNRGNTSSPVPPPDPEDPAEILRVNFDVRYHKDPSKRRRWHCRHCSEFWICYNEQDKMTKDLHDHLVSFHLEKIVDTFCFNKERKEEEGETTRRKAIIKELKKITDSNLVSLSAEFWEHHNGLACIKVNLHHVDKELKKKDVELSICQLPADEIQGADIYQSIISVAKDYKITKKVINCTYQGNKIGQILKEYLKTDGFKPAFSFVECMGYFLNSTLKKFLDSQSDVVIKLLAILSVLLTDSKEIKDQVKKLAIDKYEWRVYGYEDSWTSRCGMIRMMSKDRGEIRFMLQRSRHGGSGKRFFFYNEQMVKIRVLVGIVEEINRVIKGLMGSRQSFGRWLLALKDIESYVTRLSGEESEVDIPGDVNNALKSMSQEMIDFISTLEKQSAIQCSTLLDIEVEKQLEEKVFKGEGKVTERLIQLIEVYPQLGGGEGEKELKSYRDTLESLVCEEGSLKWWRNNKNTFPYLSVCARGCLSIAGSCKPAGVIFTGEEECFENLTEVELRARIGKWSG